MDSSPPMFGTSRPRPASSAALTRLRHHCEEAGSAGTTIHLGFLPQVGSPTARGAVPETLELSSSVTTALEALSPWLMKPRSLHDVMNCMDTARSRRLDGGPTSSEAKTTESSRVMSCSVVPCSGIGRPLPQVLLVVPCAILIIIYLQSERPDEQHSSHRRFAAPHDAACLPEAKVRGSHAEVREETTGFLAKRKMARVCRRQDSTSTKVSRKLRGMMTIAHLCNLHEY